MQADHVAERVARELAGKMSSRARHVCMLLGAGASVSAGLPTVAGLQKLVLDELPEPEKAHLERLLKNRNLEQALSRIRRIRSLLDPGQDFEGLTSDAAAELDQRVCDAIRKSVDTTGKDKASFVRLASWAGRLESTRPVELFTVNYDLLLELGLEHVGVPYFDGFLGSVNGRFSTDLIEPNEARESQRLPSGFVRVWKLHGSTNWTHLEVGGRREVVRGAQVADEPAAIYPSDEKYEESRRMPFVALMDRFRRALSEPETITLVSGYSFGDEHLNELLFDAARRHPRSEVVALCFGNIPDLLSDAAQSTRNLVVLSPSTAVIDGRSTKWAADDDVPGVFEGGSFLLGDFSRLASFLAQQVGRDDTSS